MVLNLEESLFHGVNFDDGSTNECSDKERKDSVCCDDPHDCKFEKSSEDIADLLPNDPFDMEFNIELPNDPFGTDISFTLPTDPFGMDFNLEVTVSAITGWMEDFDLKTCDEEDEKTVGSKLLGKLNLVWTGSMKFELKEGENEAVHENKTDLVTQSEDDSSYDEFHMMGGNCEELMCLGCEKYQKEHVKGYCNDANGGAPTDALFFVLGYLGVRDLLSVERVCKSLCDAVRNDPLLWRNIHIDYPLNYKIFDDDLVRLTDRAQRSLCSLSLIKCKNITNIGLKRVLESNLRLTKLSVPGCMQLNVDVILHDLKVFNSVGVPGVKRLRITDHDGITNQHLQEFKHLLGADNEKQTGSYKPRFYREGQIYLSLDDERTIDIEMCPRCQQVRQVYDCPLKNCQVNPNSAQTCRACILCVDRCINCGCCLDNTNFEETFCLDLICLDCLTQLLNCQERVTFLPSRACFHQKTSYHVVYCG